MVGGESVAKVITKVIMCGWYGTTPYEISGRLAPSLVFHIEK